MGAHSNVECAISCCYVVLVSALVIVQEQPANWSGVVMLKPHPFWHINDLENIML